MTRFPIVANKGISKKNYLAAESNFECDEDLRMSGVMGAMRYEADVEFIDWLDSACRGPWKL